MSSATSDISQTRWFFTGMRGLFSLPAIILMISFVGFSAFALQSGVSRTEAMVMTATVWALSSYQVNDRPAGFAKTQETAKRACASEIASM